MDPEAVPLRVAARAHALTHVLPGFSGRLLAEAFLESSLDDSEAAARRLARSRLLEWHARSQELGPASSVRAIFGAGARPLVELLGFEAPRAVSWRDDIAAATLTTSTHSAALLVTRWAEPLDPLWTTAIAEALDRQAAWCVLFNGRHLRVVDASRLYARRHAEFDLDAVLDEDRTLAAFWRVAHADVLAAGADRPRTKLHDLVEASDEHGAGVRTSLRTGVRDAAAEIATALAVRPTGRVAPALVALAFEQSLTIVYRMLFLLFAEARGLVPLWHPVYRNSYSIETLRAMAEQPLGGGGFWDALQAIGRLAHAGCRAGDLHVTPFNGRLFAPAHTSLAERGNLDDQAARRAVLAVSTRRSIDGRLERIGYRDLGVEQLGAVYETILDYRPRLAERRVLLEQGSGLRKATGTFYTPQPIAEYLVRRALAPLVRDAAPDRILGLRVLDPAMGSGAFLVAACRYLSREYERALVASGGCLPGDIGDGDRAAIRRTIAERCLYGVDVNPMAVQLARLSLWLATLSADRPLTFLDHRLRTGDSLVGAWLSNLTRAPIARRRRGGPHDGVEPRLFGEDRFRPALQASLPVRFSLERIPGDTIGRIREKERALAGLHRKGELLDRWRRVADLWCASWFATAAQNVPAVAFGALADRLLTGRSVLPDGVERGYLQSAAGIAERGRFFHWEIEFPEVFFGDGATRLPAPGFDAVIGNPPWDMVRADSGSDEDRERARVEGGALVRFARTSGLYSAPLDGHPNRYQLFLERALDLTRSGGRLGLVMPGGLLTDHGSGRLRRRLFTHAAIDAIAGFDNRDGVFPIHKSVRFALITATVGEPTRAIACRLGERDPSVLERIGDGPPEPHAFPVRLPMPLLDRISGDGLVVPDFRSPTDVAIAERAASLFPRLDDASGWGARFGRELNATDDRQHFSAAGAGLPIVEGKQIEPFGVDVAAARYAIAAPAARKLLPDRRFERARLGYRDVASATNRLTLIAAILPERCVTTHTVFCLRTPMSAPRQQTLCGLLNSLPVNYLVRQRVATHVTTAVVQALPVPSPATEPRALRRVGALARLLARGFQRDAYCQLQAEVARLYRLSAVEFEHVLGTFPLIEADLRHASLSIFTTEARRTRR